MPLRDGYIHAKTLSCSMGNVTNIDHAEKVRIPNLMLIEDLLYQFHISLDTLEHNHRSLPLFLTENHHGVTSRHHVFYFRPNQLIFLAYFELG
jgi:hypothetical protein